MSDSEVSARMRDDWNARAREDAGYYVAFGRREQDDAGFFETGVEIAQGIQWELRRLPAGERTRALEIGCGPGRLARHMSPYFTEVHGVDVSDEMVALAKQKNRDVPNVHFHATNGASLALFADASIDFVYSYAVFQHIPSREVVYDYLKEIARVLRPGGLAWLQFNGLSRSQEGEYNTWAGSRFTSSELLEFSREHDFQVLALDGVATQYMWTTWRKQPQGWFAALYDRKVEPALRIRRITNAHSSEPVAPSRGRFASITIWAENLPADVSLHNLHVMVGDSFGTLTYIGAPDSAGLQQVNVLLPELEATGLLPVSLMWLEQPLCAPATLRVIPPGPSVPRITTITDGVNLVAGTRIETRTVKMTLEQIARPHEIEAFIDGIAVWNLEFFCTDPRPQKFEVNFRLPEEIQTGAHQLQVRIGHRKLAPIALDVV